MTQEATNAGRDEPSLKSENDDSNPQQGTGSNNRMTHNNNKSQQMAETNHKHRPPFKVPANKKDSRKIFVGGLPSNVTDTEFQEFFKQFGEIIDSVVMFDRETRRSRGFGFVTFEDPEVARSLMTSVDETGKGVGKVTMRGKVCEVKESEPREHSGPRRGGGNRQRSNRKFRQGNSAPAESMPIMDHALLPPAVVSPNAIPGPWPGLVEEQVPPMMVPGSYAPAGVVVPGMYPEYPPAGAPVPMDPAYAAQVPYNPYTGYPPQGPPPVFPNMGYENVVPVPYFNGGNTMVPVSPGRPVAPPMMYPQVHTPPIQNGSEADQWPRQQHGGGAPTEEGEETGQA